MRALAGETAISVGQFQPSSAEALRSQLGKIDNYVRNLYRAREVV